MSKNIITLSAPAFPVAPSPSAANRRFARLALSASGAWQTAAAAVNRHLGWLLPLIILAAWELGTRAGFIKPLFLPAPLAVAQSFWDMLANDRLLHDFIISAFGVLRGYVFGAAAGLLLGLLAGVSRTVERFLGPTLDSVRQVPALAWLPLIVLWIGAGDLAKVVIIGKTVFFPVFLNTLQGIRGVSKDYIEVGRVFGYNRVQLLRRVIIPAAMPGIFVGLRLGLGLAWMTIILAEMLGGRQGLGYLLTRAQELLLTPQLFVVIVVIGSVGFLIDHGLRLAEARVLHWKKGFEG